MGDTSPATVSPFNKRQILLKIVYLKVNNIDTINEAYSADFFLTARWREPTLDVKTKPKTINWDNFYDPKLKIQNNIGEIKEKAWREIEARPGEGTFIVERRRINGRFFERLELQDFPFDIQDLSIVITSESSADEVEFVDDTTTLSNVNVDSFNDQQEWGLYDFVVGEQRLANDEYSGPKYKRAGFKFHCCAVRRVGYFVWNIMGVIAMITSLSFTSFAVDEDLPQRRLQLTFTLILVMITFKFVASQNVPKLSYLTYLDRYILMSMAFLFLVCTWHATVSLFQYDAALTATMDNAAFFGFLGLYVFAQLLFIFTVSIKFLVKRRKNEKLEDEYQKKFEALPQAEQIHCHLQRKRRQKEKPHWIVNVLPSLYDK